MEKAKSRLEWMRYITVLILLGIAFLINQPIASFLSALGLASFWAPIAAFLITAFIGYLFLFSIPRVYGHPKK